MLADVGIYLASESTFTRVRREHGQTTHRGTAKVLQARRPPTTHIATAARQVCCWDMTYLPATVIGRWFHRYLILDLYNRKIVGWEVHANDLAGHAVHLVRRTALAEGIAALTDRRSPPRVSRRWRLRVNGAPHLCVGTTWSTSTVASAMCRRSSAIPARTMPFRPPAMPFSRRRRSAIRHAGRAIRVTGVPWVRSPSTQKAYSASGRVN